MSAITVTFGPLVATVDRGHWRCKASPTFARVLQSARPNFRLRYIADHDYALASDAAARFNGIIVSGEPAKPEPGVIY